MKWVHNINRQVFGSRYWNRKDRDGVLRAPGLETQKRGVIHYHFLMSRVPGDIMRLVITDALNNMAGFAKIHPFRLKRVRSTTHPQVCRERRGDRLWWPSESGSWQAPGPVVLL
jgi:hypothetical protein